MAVLNNNHSSPEGSSVSAPHSYDAEQAVLGIILLEPERIANVTDRLTPEHFHINTHREIFAVFTQMFIIRQQIDFITVIETTVRQGIFENQSDAKKYLAKLMDSVISISSIETYAEIIEEKFMIRQLMSVSKEIYDLSSGGTVKAQELLDFAESKIYGIRNEKEIKGLIPIKPIILEKYKELSELAAHPELAKNGTGLSTSFHDLDKYIYGLNPSDLILVAGRPGMGKTTFALNIATNVAKNYSNKVVTIFSLEMSKEQLVTKIISSESRISLNQMKTGQISTADWKNFSEAADVLSRLQIFIDDTASISINEMKAKLLRVKNLGAVVIDYLQLMSTGRRDGNRVNEISEITRNLKIMAKELNVPVILISQLSRGPESRPDKRPMLSDLRESGSIEQDADIVLFVYRNSYYNKEDEHPNAGECIIAKNRHGEVNTVGLNFEGQFSRFTSVEYVHESQY